MRNLRRQLRVPVNNEAIRVSFQDPMRGLVYLRGKCANACKAGMLIKLQIPIPRQSQIAILADGMGYSGNASVRHVTRSGSHYTLGLELSHPLTAAWLEKNAATLEALSVQSICRCLFAHRALVADRDDRTLGRIQASRGGGVLYRAANDRCRLARQFRCDQSRAA